MLDKNGPRTDWTDHLNEDNTAALRAANSASTYVYKTRSNEQLFKLGFTDQLSESNDSDKIIDLLISDGVSVKAVPLFMDKKVFPNPFMKYKKLQASRDMLSSEPLKPSQGDATSKTFADCQTDIKLNESPAFSEVAKEPDSLVQSKQPAYPAPIPLPVAVDVKFDQVQPVSPPLTEEPPPVAAPPPQPQTVDPRIAIAPVTYYMHDMKLSVDDDPGIDASLAKQFKTHIVQLHQNLHEVLEAQGSEKPIAPPKDPCLTQVIGRPG
jgi:hypothetical protein